MRRDRVSLLTWPIRRLFGKAASTVARRPVRLGIESLESRAMPDGVPAFDYYAPAGSVV